MTVTRVCTFGSAHVCPITGESLANSYVRVQAENEAEVRRIMHTRFGNRWSFMYLDEAAAGVDRYELIQVHLHGEGRPA
jgi:hypothetical protein